MGIFQLLVRDRLPGRVFLPHNFQETFYEDRELYAALLAPVVTVDVSTTYVRVVDDSEEVRCEVVAVVNQVNEVV